MKQFNRISSILIPVLFFAIVLLNSACGEKGDSPVSEHDKNEKPETAQKLSMTETPASKGNTVPGWQKVSYENYTFSLPGNWKGDTKIGIWCPGDLNLDMGRPSVSLHIGATPVMPGSNVEDGLKRYYGIAPTDTGNETRTCGMDGSYVEVTNNGFKHMGLILVEGKGIKILNFFDCQAPADSFDGELETFKKILDTVACR